MVSQVAEIAISIRITRQVAISQMMDNLAVSTYSLEGEMKFGYNQYWGNYHSLYVISTKFKSWFRQY